MKIGRLFRKVADAPEIVGTMKLSECNHIMTEKVGVTKTGRCGKG